MKTLGEWLRQARESKGLSFEEIEAAIRIRPRFLQALESEDFAAFPGGEVQIRGFLRLYARHLGLSADEALARYDAEVHGTAAFVPAPPAPSAPASRATATPSPPASPPARPPVVPPPSSTRPPLRFPSESLLIGGAVLMLILAIVAAAGYYLSRQLGEQAEATATPTVTVTPLTATPQKPSGPAPTPTFPVSPDGKVTLTLEATEHVWVRVKRDGQTVWESMLAPGQSKTWTGQQMIIVETGNGAGLQVTVNGQPQGAMCGRAEVCTRAWAAIGEVLLP